MAWHRPIGPTPRKRIPGVSLCTRKHVARRSRLKERGLRFYNPGMGRWLSRDPVGERSGHNLYAFCDNDAIDRGDGDGQDWHVLTVIGGSSSGFRRRGSTTVYYWDFFYRVTPQASSDGSQGCCKLEITKVKLLMQVDLPGNASTKTIEHEFEHVFDFATQLHDAGMQYFLEYAKDYKSCTTAKCVNKALADHARPMLVSRACAYTIKRVDFPDTGSGGENESKYYYHFWREREMGDKLWKALRECEDEE